MRRLALQKLETRDSSILSLRTHLPAWHARRCSAAGSGNLRQVDVQVRWDLDLENQAYTEVLGPKSKVLRVVTEIPEPIGTSWSSETIKSAKLKPERKPYTTPIPDFLNRVKVWLRDVAFKTIARPINAIQGMQSLAKNSGGEGYYHCYMPITVPINNYDRLYYYILEVATIKQKTVIQIITPDLTLDSFTKAFILCPVVATVRIKVQPPLPAYYNGNRL